MASVVRWLRARHRDERGSVSVETVILLPGVIVLSMVALQVAMVLHAREAASTAARMGLDQARVVEGTAAAGQSATKQFLGKASEGLRNPSATVERTAEEVTVTVSGDVMSLVPGWAPTVTVTVSAPVERWVE